MNGWERDGKGEGRAPHALTLAHRRHALRLGGRHCVSAAGGSHAPSSRSAAPTTHPADLCFGGGGAPVQWWAEAMQRSWTAG
jgi:hypothetical protein